MHNDQSCKLGQGAYGTVCMVEHLPTGKLLAAKIPRDAEAAGSLQKELHAMAALADHPSFLQPVDASSPGSLVSWIVLPLHGISAHEYLTRSGPLSSDVIHPFAHQLLAALSYLCQRGFVHCDVVSVVIFVSLIWEYAKPSLSRTSHRLAHLAHNPTHLSIGLQSCGWHLTNVAGLDS